MNLRPSGYEPDELPSCSTPRYDFVLSFRVLIYYITANHICQVFFLKNPNFFQIIRNARQKQRNEAVFAFV